MNSSGSSYTMAGNIVSFLFWILVLGVIFYNLFIRKNKNRAKAALGEDLQRVRQAVRGLLPPDSQNAEIVYAHWEDVQSSGRTVRTTYYRYAAAFRDETLWVFPLQIDKGTHEVKAGSPWVLTPDRLGKVTVTIQDKAGEIRRVETWLADKEGNVILQLYVNAENLAGSKYLPMNILQEDECAAFERFISPLAQRVAAENPGIDQKIARDEARGMSGITIGLSVGGLLAGILSPFFGLILCLAGLLFAIYGKRRGNPKNGALITGCACMLLSVVYLILYYTVLFV